MLLAPDGPNKHHQGGNRLVACEGRISFVFVSLVGLAPAGCEVVVRFGSLQKHSVLARRRQS